VARKGQLTTPTIYFTCTQFPSDPLAHCPVFPSVDGMKSLQTFEPPQTKAPPTPQQREIGGGSVVGWVGGFCVLSINVKPPMGVARAGGSRTLNISQNGQIWLFACSFCTHSLASSYANKSRQHFFNSTILFGFTLTLAAKEIN